MRLHTPTSRLFWLSATLVALGAASPVPTSARSVHLHLLKSAPVPNDTLAQPPGSISLWFSQRVELPVTSVHVSGPSASTIALSPLVAADTARELVVARITSPLPAGRYRVAWRTMARDGHVVRGEFAFSVAADGAH